MEARRTLGIDNARLVERYGDKEESKSLRQIQEFQKHIEKDFNRVTREALRRTEQAGRDRGTNDRDWGEW